MQFICNFIIHLISHQLIYEHVGLEHTVGQTAADESASSFLSTDAIVTWWRFPPLVVSPVGFEWPVVIRAHLQGASLVYVYCCAATIISSLIPKGHLALMWSTSRRWARRAGQKATLKSKIKEALNTDELRCVMHSILEAAATWRSKAIRKLKHTVCIYTYMYIYTHEKESMSTCISVLTKTKYLVRLLNTITHLLHIY